MVINMKELLKVSTTFVFFFNTDNGFVLLYKHALLKIVLPKDFILKAPDRESTRRT